MENIAETNISKLGSRESVENSITILQKNRSNKIIKKLLLWLLFNVFISILPFLFHYIALNFFGNSVNWTNILANGELFLITVAITAGALGDLIASKFRQSLSLIIIVGSNILILLIASFCYALSSIFNSTILSINQSINNIAIFQWSLWIFGASFIVSTICVFLSEVE